MAINDKTIRGLGCLDILFSNVRRYRRSAEARALFEFTAGFPKLAPLNALLVHIQQPHSRMVATADDWQIKYGRKLKFNARPLIILWPFGPVNFVFDIGDTVATENALDIPEAAINPFQPSGYLPDSVWRTLSDNLPALGILQVQDYFGSQAGGSILRMSGKYYLRKRNQAVKILYAIKLKRNAGLLANFCTLLHELGHLYCGHLNSGAYDKRFPDRAELEKREPVEKKIIKEFEAESVAWLVFRRLGLESPADIYLSSYWRDEDMELPDISLNTIFWAAGKIEALCKKPCDPCKECVIDPGGPEAMEYKEWDDCTYRQAGQK